MAKLGMGMMRLPLLDENDQKSVDMNQVHIWQADLIILTLHLFIMKE